DGHHFAEHPPQLAHLDHGEGPAKLSKNGGRLRVWAQPASSASAAPASRNCATSSGTQPCMVVPWPTPGTITCSACERVARASSARAGGVTGSSSPERSSTGTSERTGSWKPGGTSPRGQKAQTSISW